MTPNKLMHLFQALTILHFYTDSKRKTQIQFSFYLAAIVNIYSGTDIGSFLSILPYILTKEKLEIGDG